MPVTTLSEFIEWAAQFSDGQYLFRGVSTKCYKIEASAYRRLPETDRNNPSKLLKINKDLIEKARSLGHDQRDGQQLSDLELLAELQHFGAATCLIDFTRSALVALWFACKREANGKVFAVRRDDPARFKTVNPELVKEDIEHFFKPENGRYPRYQWQPKLQNNRIIAQQSIFVFSGDPIDADAECVIRKDSKRDIRTSLDKISGITEANIYPDFDGFARLHAHDKPYIEPDAQDYLQRGLEAHQNGNLDDAIEYYTEVIRLKPEDTSIVFMAHYNRGVAYETIDRIDSAIEDYNQAIQLNPNSAEAYYNRGYAYFAKDNFDSAFEDYNQAIQLNQDFAGAYNNRGVVYGKKDEIDSAIEDYNQAIQLNPNFAEAYYNRGVVYGKKDEIDSAFEDFNQAIQLNQDFAEAYYNRGVAYYKRGEFQRAIEDCNQAIRLKSDRILFYSNRFFALLAVQEWEKAKSDLTTVGNMEEDIIALFHDSYASIADFEQKHGVELPEDIAAMLTPP